MEQTRDFLKGFGLGLVKIVVFRLVFTGARVVGLFGFLALIWWKPHIFGHPYAPFIGIGLVVAGGIAWRARDKMRFSKTLTSGGWNDLGVDESHGKRVQN